MKGNEIIQESAALRGQGKYQEAIDLIEANLPDIDGDIRLNAQFEAFRAAVEAGNAETAREYATTIAAEELAPPSILTVSLINGAFHVADQDGNDGAGQPRLNEPRARHGSVPDQALM
ncbi:hypothetical protein [Paraburkholderia lacunae]|uniref:Uncharacterized protein n=1 Tax=Paraburkholderia lacunae TaxID=2211104 RepID=A0A370N5B7_9BURK|nr:hypothetical protein [Paraburkholderia lacunae]RDK00814.1 hypothetical protein DLM46_20920 [Paraburkholderia lacunae]